jgi:hypothetical protein
MQNRLFTALVLLLWLCSMTWLIAYKIVPSLLVGSPPSYDTTLPPEEDRNATASWHVLWNDRPVGRAASTTERDEDGAAEIRSLLSVEDLPLRQMLPQGAASLLSPLGNRMGNLDFDIRSHAVIDPLGHLTSFQTNVELAQLTDDIEVQGYVKDGVLHVTLRSGDFHYRTEKELPPGALVTNELAPYAYLRDLRLGQSWTVPVYSPLRSPHRPLEMLQATVESEDLIEWGGRPVQTLVIVYRGESGASSLSEDSVSARLWVRDDGLVLRQEVSLLGSRLRFERMTEAEAAKFQPQPVIEQVVPQPSAVPAVQPESNESSESEPASSAPSPRQ